MSVIALDRVYLGDGAAALQFAEPAIYKGLTVQPQVGTWVVETIADIHRIQKKYSSNGWDGQDAKAITSDVAKCSVLFINSLPVRIARPIVSPDPQGNIQLEWRNGFNAIVTANINESRIVFAGLYKKGAKEITSSASIPSSVGAPDEFVQFLLKYIL